MTGKQQMEFSHIPVMFEECMTALALKDDGIYFEVRSAAVTILSEF